MIGPTTASCRGRKKQSNLSKHVPPPSSPRQVRSRNSLPFGDALRTKRSNVTRVFCQNPNGLGPSHDSRKMLKLKNFLLKHSPDIVGFPESNLYNSLLPLDAQWDKRVKGWFEHTRTSISFNTKVQTPTRAQKGGTAMLACAEHALRMSNKGFDFRSLGRWNWMRFSGQNKFVTRVITVYCCNKKSSSTGNTTVYSMQKAALMNEGIFECPRVQFWLDLKEEVTKWIAAGDRIILMGDWNHPISVVQEHLKQFSLLEAILDAANRDPSLAPATYNRGSQVIDGMFHSPSLVVVSSGYLPFNHGVGDHRLLWADFLQRSVLGFDLTPLTGFQARRLKVSDPRIKKKYMDLRHAHLQSHNYYSRLATLFSLSTKIGTSTLELDQEYECLDKIASWAMLTAEKHCRPLFTGSHAWSPSFSLAMDTIEYWTIRCQYIAGIHIDKREMIRYQKRLGITYTPLTYARAKVHLDEAWKKYKEVKKFSDSHHVSYRESLAQAQADAGNISFASTLRALTKQEESRRSSRNIKYALGKSFSAGTSSVIVKDAAGVETEITGKDEMEQALIPSSEKKYHSTEQYCPLLQGQLLDDIGILGEGPQVENILNGTYLPPPSAPRGAVLFLQAVQRPDSLTTFPIYNVRDYIAAWSRAKERTSSGVLHFGHFKAGCDNELIALAQFMMSQIPNITGYSPRRWKQATDVMLLKRCGELWVEKLRTIVLYEADFNMNNKRLGYEAMKIALSLGLIAPEQYSRPYRSAIDHVLNRRLVFDHFRLVRRPFGLSCVDLKGCYDRIVHSAATLALRRIGIPANRIKSMFGTIQKTIHKVRTLYGDSTATYGGEDLKHFLFPIQGVGQGNGAGPVIWSILSSTIFFALRKMNCGVRFVSALTKELMHLCGFAYVDDCDMIETAASAAEVEQRMQTTISLWEDMVAATGGVLDPIKSWWYLVDFKWHHGRWSYTSPTPSSELLAHDRDANSVPLRRLQPSDASEMLGVFLAPDGNHSLQLQSMTEKVKVWCTRISHANLPKPDLWQAMLTTIFKSLEYPLPALTLSPDHYVTLVWPIIKLVLPKSGICRNITSSVRHGPVSSGGLAVPHLYIKSGVCRIRKLIEHTWKCTPTGPLLSNTLEPLILEYGLYGSVFDIDRSVAAHSLLTPNLWIEDTLCFMQENHIKLHYLHFALSPRRLYDESLMAGFHRLSLSTADIQSLNRCRLYLQVVSLSDISNGRGDQIDPRWIREPRAPLPLPAGGSRSQYDWPTQQGPPSSDWAVWRLCISKAWCSSYPLLSRPLGNWLATPETVLSAWDWFVSNDGQSLFLQDTPTRWYSFTPCSARSRHRFLLSSKAPCHHPPSALTVYRCTVENCYGALACSSFHHTLVAPPPVSHRLPSLDRLRSITPSIHLLDTLQNALLNINDASWICEWFHSSASISSLLVDLVTGQAFAVSDGSYFPDSHRGSAAWIITSADRTEYIQGGGLVTGPVECQSAYRSELAGLLGIAVGILGLHTVAKLHDFYPRSEDLLIPAIPPDMVVACDGLTALNRCFQNTIESASLTWQQFDIVSSVIGWWSILPFTPVHKHVKGHQEKIIPYDQLPLLGQLNVDMDYFAKWIVRGTDNVPRPLRFPTYEFGIAIVEHDGVLVPSDIENSLYHALTSKPLIDHWLQRFSFENTALDWTSFGNARTNSTRARQHFVSKWLSGHVGLGKVLAQRGHSVFHRCPRCTHGDDTALHCLTCPKAKKLFSARVTKLRIWMEDQKTDPSISALLPIILREWFRQKHSFSCESILLTSDCAPSSQLSMMFLSQEKIGFDKLFYGFISPGWVEVQDAYYSSIESQRTGRRWASRFIRQMWEFLFVLWDDRNIAKHHRKSTVTTTICPPSRLRRFALAEFHKGHSGLVPFLRSYFHISENQLRTKSPEDLRLWLHAVICGREREDPSYESPFLHDRPLRSWLGLRPKPPPEPPPAPPDA